MTLATLFATIFIVVELNCENLFDCSHDSLKNDVEWTPDGSYRWTHKRYWRKVNRIAQTIIACGEEDNDWALPDLVALTEVENDSVMTDLTKKSLLRHARYNYLMTNSPDERGIDVALLYSPFSFRLINSYSLRVGCIENMKPTRDILYAKGELISGDTLHVFVVHSPSRSGGEIYSRPFRKVVAQRLLAATDSIWLVEPDAKIMMMGDFNDYSGDEAIEMVVGKGFSDVGKDAKGSNGAKGTYRYRGRWGSLDHIFASLGLRPMLKSCFIFDAPFLLEKDKTYGGTKPRRNYLGNYYQNGFSDHLPLVVRFEW